MTTNLYRIDDVLLRAGLAIGAFAALAVSATVADLDGGSLRLTTAAGLALLVACPLTLLYLGWKMRRHEKLVGQLWRLVAARGQVSFQQAHEVTSLGRRQIAAAVEQINARANAVLVWDEKAGVILDASVQRHTLAHSEDCRSCGGRFNVEVRTSQTDYSCPYCGAGLDCARINPMLAQLQARESLRRHQPDAPVALARPPGKKLNIVVFLLLLAIFWPLAIVYVVKCNSN